VVPFAEWIRIGSLNIPGTSAWTPSRDDDACCLRCGTLIHIYAIGYMHEDVRFKNDVGRYSRFFVFLNLFIAMIDDPGQR